MARYFTDFMTFKWQTSGVVVLSSGPESYLLNPEAQRPTKFWSAEISLVLWLRTRPEDIVIIEWKVSGVLGCIVLCGVSSSHCHLSIRSAVRQTNTVMYKASVGPGDSGEAASASQSSSAAGSEQERKGFHLDAAVGKLLEGKAEMWRNSSTCFS